jgi:hypothetical protein
MVLGGTTLKTQLTLLRLATWGLTGLLISTTSLSYAQDETVSERLNRGEVNWSEKVILATGSGIPNLKLPNVAAIRQASERAATVAAVANLMEALQGLRITGEEIAGTKLKQKQIRTQVESIVKKCKTADTRYFSDYGVDVVLKCPLNGALAMVLAPPTGQKSFQTAGKRTYTGLIVDAVGLKAKPALAFRILRPDGTAFYEREIVKPNFFRTYGPASYSRSIEGAKQASKVGDNPLVIRAAGMDVNGTDVRISDEDLGRLTAENLWFLLEGRVVVATDGP